MVPDILRQSVELIVSLVYFDLGHSVEQTRKKIFSDSSGMPTESQLLINFLPEKFSEIIFVRMKFCSLAEHNLI